MNSSSIPTAEKSSSGLKLLLTVHCLCKQISSSSLMEILTERPTSGRSGCQ